MSYAVVQDFPASWVRYAACSGGLSDPTPDGLILFAAGPTDEGVRIVAVWEDEPSWSRFREQRLDPVVATLLDGHVETSVVRDVRLQQVWTSSREEEKR